ncbi:MAG TPA: DNA-binding protein [Flavobacteriales bacterium]|nr:DNA-binding protein [Flavobacteriales bacterium]
MFRMDKKYLSVNEAAEHLNISDRAVRQRIKARTIQAEKVGNAWRIYSAQFREDTEPNPETHAMIDFLKSEIAEKNRHIAELTKTLQQQQTLLLIAEDKQRPWWARILASMKRQDHTIVT